MDHKLSEFQFSIAQSELRHARALHQQLLAYDVLVNLESDIMRKSGDVATLDLAGVDDRRPYLQGKAAQQKNEYPTAGCFDHMSILSGLVEKKKKEIMR